MQPSSLLLTMLWRSAPTRLLVMIGVLVILVLSTGCAELSGAMDHGWEGDEYEHTYLSTGSPLGAKALKNWRNYDIDVRQFLREYRDPDVIYSKFSEVTFFYLEEKVQVRCVRGGFKTKIEKTTIPENLYQRLRQLFN